MRLELRHFVLPLVVWYMVADGAFACAATAACDALGFASATGLARQRAELSSKLAQAERTLLQPASAADMKGQLARKTAAGGERQRLLVEMQAVEGKRPLPGWMPAAFPWVMLLLPLVTFVGPMLLVALQQRRLRPATESGPRSPPSGSP